VGTGPEYARAKRAFETDRLREWFGRRTVGAADRAAPLAVSHRTSAPGTARQRSEPGGITTPDRVPTGAGARRRRSGRGTRGAPGSPPATGPERPARRANGPSREASRPPTAFRRGPVVDSAGARVARSARWRWRLPWPPATVAASSVSRPRAVSPGSWPRTARGGCRTRPTGAPAESNSRIAFGMRSNTADRPPPRLATSTGAPSQSPADSPMRRSDATVAAGTLSAAVA